MKLFRFDDRPPVFPALATDDPMPPGPFTAGMTWNIGPDAWTPPYVVRSNNGQVIAGGIPSLVIARVIAAALNGEP